MNFSRKTIIFTTEHLHIPLLSREGGVGGGKSVWPPGHHQHAAEKIPVPAEKDQYQIQSLRE
jgi:hypothetical protein